MSWTRSKAPLWPGITNLSEAFAALVMEVADLRQSQEGWTKKETVEVIRATAEESVEEVAKALTTAAELSLDVWAATR